MRGRTRRCAGEHVGELANVLLARRGGAIIVRGGSAPSTRVGHRSRASILRRRAPARGQRQMPRAPDSRETARWPWRRLPVAARNTARAASSSAKSSSADRASAHGDRRQAARRRARSSSHPSTPRAARGKRHRLHTESRVSSPRAAPRRPNRSRATRRGPLRLEPTGSIPASATARSHCPRTVGWSKRCRSSCRAATTIGWDSVAGCTARRGRAAAMPA
jgi:hypothetical protein